MPDPTSFLAEATECYDFPEASHNARFLREKAPELQMLCGCM